jgi:uncharacterized protein YgiM (DUF1202 family)
MYSSSTPVQAQVFSGTNWQAQYFNDPNFTTLITSRVENNPINISWGSGGPFDGVVDNFSVIWTGIQSFPNTGTYQFTISRDEDAEVIFNNAVIIPFQNGIGTTTYTASVSVNAGNYPITVRYREVTGNAFVVFNYTFGGGGAGGTPVATATRTITPLPAIPPGALTATVIRASVLNVRDAPSLGGGRLGTILRGQTYQVVGRNENATWFLLQLSGYQGWAWGYYLFVNGNEFNAPVRSPFGTIGVPPGVIDTGVVAQSESTMRLRSEPNVASAQIGRITWGGFLPVIGRTSDGFWYQVVWKGTVGWVYSPFLRITQGDLNSVPIVR